MTSFARSFSAGIVRWRVTVNQPGHFRAEARLAWRQASADEKALFVFLLVIVLGNTILAMISGWLGLGAGWRLLRGGAHPAAWREMLLFLVGSLGWFGLLYAWAPKVWVLEARPGSLRFGWRTWEAAEVEALIMERRQGKTSASWSDVYDVSRSRGWSVTDFWLRLADGRRVRLWKVNGRARGIAEEWMRQLAAVGGVSVAED